MIMFTRVFISFVSVYEFEGSSEKSLVKVDFKKREQLQNNCHTLLGNPVDQVRLWDKICKL